MVTALQSLDTFYVVEVCAECISGYIFLSEYIDPCLVDDILQGNAGIPCNTSSDMMIFTTNPEVNQNTDYESVILFEDDDFQEERVQVSYHGPGRWIDGVYVGKTSEKISPAPLTLFNCLFEEGGDYENVSLKHWTSGTACCIWENDIYDNAVSEALSAFSANQSSQEDIAEYKRLKSKLGV